MPDLESHQRSTGLQVSAYNPCSNKPSMSIRYTSQFENHCIVNNKNYHACNWFVWITRKLFRNTLIEVSVIQWKIKLKTHLSYAKMNFHPIHDFWLALTLTFWSLKLQAQMPLIWYRFLTSSLMESWHFWSTRTRLSDLSALQQSSWLTDLAPSSEKKWHLALLTHIKKLHHVLYNWNMTDCPIWCYLMILLLQLACEPLWTSWWWQTWVGWQLPFWRSWRQWYSFDRQDLCLSSSNSWFEPSKERTLKSFIWTA